ncbi:MAG: hypothetical protein IJT75_08670 [Bacteroidaceae bacterium]|nr:hypothetical protein [Bacteroidaceae bacterium]
MSETVLANMRDYLTGALQPNELMWLIDELIPYAAMPEGTLKPYTMEEINARIDEAERQSAAGEFCDHEEIFKMLDEELGLTEVEKTYKTAV